MKSILINLNFFKNLYLRGERGAQNKELSIFHTDFLIPLSYQPNPVTLDIINREFC